MMECKSKGPFYFKANFQVQGKGAVVLPFFSFYIPSGCDYALALRCAALRANQILQS